MTAAARSTIALSAVMGILSAVLSLALMVLVVYPFEDARMAHLIRMTAIMGAFASTILWFPGTYLWQKERLGRSGAAGFCVCVLSLIVIAYWVYISDGVNTQQTFALWNSVALLACIWGLLMFGTASLQSGYFPSFATLLWMTGLLLGCTMGHAWPGRILMFSTGLIWCGFHYFRHTPQAFPTAGASQPSDRHTSLDLLRGLIMILMAIDHASLMIRKTHPFEFWQYPIFAYNGQIVDFLTRFVTHLCAPGFFFLMGAGVILFSESRRAREWTTHRVITRLTARGMILLLLEKWIFNPMLYGNMALTKFSVLFGLGGAMVLCALAVRLHWHLLLAAGLAIVLLTQVLPQAMMDLGWYGHPLAIMFLVPKTSGAWVNIYPIIPWTGIALLGMGFGKGLVRRKDTAFSALFYASLAGLALFIGLRWAGGFGNFQPIAKSDLIGFFNLVKYPPSLVFTLLTLGINGLLLCLFEQRHHLLGMVKKPLLVFGRTALFFYLVHWFLFAGMGMPFYFITANRAWLYGGWILGLVLLYPVCNAYLSFKARTLPDTVWRMI